MRISGFGSYFKPSITRNQPQFGMFNRKTIAERKYEKAQKDYDAVVSNPSSSSSERNKAGQERDNRRAEATTSQRNSTILGKGTNLLGRTGARMVVHDHLGAVADLTSTVFSDSAAELVTGNYNLVEKASASAGGGIGKYSTCCNFVRL